MISREFSFLSAGFPHGAYQSQNNNQPELRAPSVKGQLRWWFDALFDHKNAEDSIFGSIEKESESASLISIRVEELAAPKLRNIRFMPHKTSGSGNKQCILPNDSYRVSLIPRRNGLNGAQTKMLERVLDTWLLIGAVGQRANRAAGSLLSTKDVFATNDAFLTKARDSLKGSPIKIVILDREIATEEVARKLAGDMLASDAFDEIKKYPFGSAKPRIPSALKLRVVKIGDELKLAAIWDSRGFSHNDLRGAVDILAESKEIGQLLKTKLGELN